MLPHPHQDPIVIVGAARTPWARSRATSRARCARPGGAAIKTAVARAERGPWKVDEVLFGNCLMAGQGQAPARQAASKWPAAQHRRMTLSKDVRRGHGCHHPLRTTSSVAGSRDVMVSGGMESMTNAPYLLKRAVAATAWATTRSSTT